MLKYFRKNKKGFTLIELLIVVAIIGILAAIAIPNLLTAQRRARYSRGAGDSRSIVTQAQVVTSDYNKTAGQLGLAMPAALWTQPTPLGLTQLPVYMTKVNDPWMVAGTNYGWSEVAAAGCVLGPGCVVYASWTAGADAAATAWNGTAAITADDLGSSTVMGCSAGPTVGIAGIC